VKSGKRKRATHAQADEVYAVDAAFINLKSDRERQAYTLIKDRVFANTKEFHPNLREKIGMDSKFISIWHALGWEDFVPVQEVGSRPTTIHSALYNRMRLVFHFDFMEFSIKFRGKISVAPSVFVVAALFLLRKLVLVLIVRVFGKRTLVSYSR
jgi:hypothetical protein